MIKFLFSTSLFAIVPFLSWSVPKNVQCPPAVTPHEIQQLQQNNEFVDHDIVFKLDGSSRALMKKISHQSKDHDSRGYPLVYHRVEGGNLVCWYQTEGGYLGLRQK